MERVRKHVDSTINMGEAALRKAKRLVALGYKSKPSARTLSDVPIAKPTVSTTPSNRKDVSSGA